IPQTPARQAQQTVNNVILFFDVFRSLRKQVCFDVRFYVATPHRGHSEAEVWLLLENHQSLRFTGLRQSLSERLIGLAIKNAFSALKDHWFLISQVLEPARSLAPQ